MYNPDEICAPCADAMARKLATKKRPNNIDLYATRVLWVLQEAPTALMPLGRILADMPSGAIGKALDRLEAKGYVIKRVKGHGCALLAEPLEASCPSRP